MLLIDTKSTGETLHWLIFCILQSGRCLPECHPSGRLHHDGDEAGLERRVRGGEGRPALCRPQCGLPAPAPGV